MKAEEARNKAMENARSQIDLVTTLIEEALLNGQLSLYLPIPLMDATIKHLKDNGYTVTISDGTNMYKKWRVQISWGQS
jgi:hypothetical protein